MLHWAEKKMLFFVECSSQSRGQMTKMLNEIVGFYHTFCYTAFRTPHTSISRISLDIYFQIQIFFEEKVWSKLKVCLFWHQQTEINLLKMKKWDQISRVTKRLHWTRWNIYMGSDQKFQGKIALETFLLGDENNSNFISSRILYLQKRFYGFHRK